MDRLTSLGAQPASMDLPRKVRSPSSSQTAYTNRSSRPRCLWTCFESCTMAEAAMQTYANAWSPSMLLPKDKHRADRRGCPWVESRSEMNASCPQTFRRSVNVLDPGVVPGLQKHQCPINQAIAALSCPVKRKNNCIPTSG